ncbi:MAG: hypothetical protein DRN61_03050 [Thaumarchaeota archaeon]|nr:MAG: hypothetical protein DRN61_03050 [Nitrososphaerota archaeon]
MLKTIHLVKKLPDLSFEEFKRYWLEEHIKYSKKIPGVKRYVINIVTGGPGEKPYDGVAELDFESEEAFWKAYETPDAKEAVEDAKKFTERIDVLFVEEHVVKKPRAKPKKKKVKRKARKPRKKAKKRARK